MQYSRNYIQTNNNGERKQKCYDGTLFFKKCQGFGKICSLYRGFVRLKTSNFQENNQNVRYIKVKLITNF